MSIQPSFKGAKIAFSGICAGGKSIAQALPKAGESIEIATAGTESDLVQYIWEKLGPEYRAIVLQRRQVL